MKTTQYPKGETPDCRPHHADRPDRGQEPPTLPADSASRALGPVEAMRDAQWSLDVVAKMPLYVGGQRPSVLAVVDNRTRECLASEAMQDLRAERVVTILRRLVAVHGVPRSIRVDHGAELHSQALLAWAQALGVDATVVPRSSPVGPPKGR